MVVERREVLETFEELSKRDFDIALRNSETFDAAYIMKRRSVIM